MITPLQQKQMICHCLMSFKLNGRAHNCRELQNSDILLLLLLLHKLTKPKILVAYDTDILVLLCFHLLSSMHNLYLQPEPHHVMKKAPRCWNMGVVKTTFGEDICYNILFVHAVFGCDTTSKIYSLGKGAALKLVSTCQGF